MTKVKVNWDLATDVDEALVALCPTGCAGHVRQKDDRRRGAGRGRKGRFHLPQFRRRHDPERRRVHASTRLRRSTA